MDFGYLDLYKNRNTIKTIKMDPFTTPQKPLVFVPPKCPYAPTKSYDNNVNNVNNAKIIEALSLKLSDCVNDGGEYQNNAQNTPSTPNTSSNH